MDTAKMCGVAEAARSKEARRQGGKEARREGSREKPVLIEVVGLAADAVLDHGVYWG